MFGCSCKRRADILLHQQHPIFLVDSLNFGEQSSSQISAYKVHTGVPVSAYFWHLVEQSQGVAALFENSSHLRRKNRIFHTNMLSPCFGSDTVTDGMSSQSGLTIT